VTDPLRYCTSATYDAVGRLMQVQNALGFIATIIYDADTAGGDGRPVAQYQQLRL
jgi:hypothetical protein